MKFLYLDRDDSKLGMTMSPAMKLYVIFGSYLERFFLSFQLSLPLAYTMQFSLSKCRLYKHIKCVWICLSSNFMPEQNSTESVSKCSRNSNRKKVKNLLIWLIMNSIWDLWACPLISISFSILSALKNNLLLCLLLRDGCQEWIFNKILLQFSPQKPPNFYKNFTQF